MDAIKPWLVKAVRDGPLSMPSTTDYSNPPSVLPLHPVRGRKVQFIRFLSPHNWGSHQPVWAEASDRHVTILVYLSSGAISKFEADQKADKRPLSQLGYPSFSLGACRWIWDAPPPNNTTRTNTAGRRYNQLCLKVVQDLPQKPLRFGSVASFPYPPIRSGSSQNFSKHLRRLASVMSNDERWILLVKKLEVTKDPRLTVSGDVEMNTEHAGFTQNGLPALCKVMVAVPYTGPSKRVRDLKARRRLADEPLAGHSAAHALSASNAAVPSSEDALTPIEPPRLTEQTDYTCPRPTVASRFPHASGCSPASCALRTAPGSHDQAAQLAPLDHSEPEDICAAQPAVSNTGPTSPRSHAPPATVVIRYTGHTPRARDLKAHRARVRARAGHLVTRPVLETAPADRARRKSALKTPSKVTTTYSHPIIVTSPRDATTSV